MICLLKLTVFWLNGKEKIGCQCQSSIGINSR